MKKAKELISEITENLFLKEPLMFDILCSHKLQENSDMQVMFRTGQGRIEYNPELVEKNKDKVEVSLKNEILRILLLHPYQRLPDNPNRKALKKASDITINSVSPYISGLTDACYYKLQEGLSYEEYYKELKMMYSEEKKFSQGNGAQVSGDSEEYDATELWTEDSSMCDTIEKQIEKAAAGNRWGSLIGTEIEKITARKKINLDYKRILMKFRNSVIADTRSLTRLRPNRRYDFDYMGSRYKPSYNLLVAVDSSGSISHKDLENFFSIINRFFKHGAKNIKALVFDVQIQQELDFKRARYEIKVQGRGGTSFQPVIDYYEKSKDYDGLIIFTDGFADLPKITKKKKILWILNNKINFQFCHMLQKLPASSVTWIPEKV